MNVNTTVVCTVEATEQQLQYRTEAMSQSTHIKKVPEGTCYRTHFTTLEVSASVKRTQRRFRLAIVVVFIDVMSAAFRRKQQCHRQGHVTSVTTWQPMLFRFLHPIRRCLAEKILRRCCQKSHCTAQSGSPNTRIQLLLLAPAAPQPQPRSWGCPLSFSSHRCRLAFDGTQKVQRVALRF